EFLKLDALPRRILFIGGGYIAAEFSHLAARAGADVTVVQRGPKLLPHFDPDLVDLLLPRFAELGIAIHTDTEVTAIAPTGQALEISTRGGDEPQSFEADPVVHAAGRYPVVDHLNLDPTRLSGDRGRFALPDHRPSTSIVRGL